MRYIALMTIHADNSSDRSIDEQISEAILVQIFRKKVMHRDLAHAAGIGQSSWTHRMQGTRPWRAEEVVRVAAALNVPAATLLPELLPHLDSNQEPSDYMSAQVTALWHPSMGARAVCPSCGCDIMDDGWCDNDECEESLIGNVVDLGAYRTERAS